MGAPKRDEKATSCASIHKCPCCQLKSNRIVSSLSPIQIQIRIYRLSFAFHSGFDSGLFFCSIRLDFTWWSWRWTDILIHADGDWCETMKKNSRSKFRNQKMPMLRWLIEVSIHLLPTFYLFIESARWIDNSPTIFDSRKLFLDNFCRLEHWTVDTLGIAVNAYKILFYAWLITRSPAK